MSWCEANDVDYVLGLARNGRLLARSRTGWPGRSRHSHRPARPRFKDFTYGTLESWSRERRVVGKAEHLAKGRTRDSS